MRILKVYDGDYPWDVRVEKIADSLIAAGHEVHLLCRNLKRRKRRERLPGGLELVRLPALPGPFSFPAFVNPIWAGYLYAAIRRLRPDRLLVRDLPLAPLVVAVGRLCGIPVVADLAEPYPESLRSQRLFDRLSLIDRIVRDPVAAEIVERYVIRHAAGIIVVCPEAGRRLIPQGLAADAWIEVGNTPRLEQFVARGTTPECLAGFEESFVLFFGGLLAGDRGLDVAIDALARLEARRPGRFALLIVGDGPVRAALEAQSERLALADRVRFTGYLPHDQFPDLMRSVDVGLLPFHACPHINHTIANKLFEYMALSLPVIASDVPPMVRILEECRSGVSFRSGDADDLARVVEALETDAQGRERFGENGRQAVSERYNWNVDAERLVAAFEGP